MPTLTESPARSRTWFITGGTPGGFGMAYAEAALSRGDRVALTARRGDLLQGWARDHGDRALALSLDVTDPAQVQAAVGAAEERFGGIDVLVNSAGRGWVGSVEGMDEADLRSLFELNFFAAVRLTSVVARFAFSRSRTAPTTSAPCAASARAVSIPIPAETPVTKIRLPFKSTPASTSSVVDFAPNAVAIPNVVAILHSPVESLTRALALD